MTNKNIILTIIGIIGATILFFFIKYVSVLVIEDVKVNRAMRVIEEAKKQYNKCQEIIKQTHFEAEEARATIKDIKNVDEEVVNVGDVSAGFLQPPQQVEAKLPGAERTLTGPQSI